MSIELGGQLRLPERELALLEDWKRTDLQRRVNESRRGERPWVTYEGPPTVNGLPALHHVFTSTHKDIYARFQTMRGRYVDRRAGWDCQGLPVEINVERRLGLSDKQAVVDYGIDRFTEECRRFVTENIVQFEEIFERVGFGVDFDRAYRTMDGDFIESVWWHLKQLFTAEQLYEGHKVIPYCPRCGTALSSHELGQPGVYAERVDLAAYVGLELEDMDASLVVWTTTPWTLPANVAVAVAPDREYGIFERDGRRLILAADRGEEVFGDEAEPVERLRGHELIGRRYRRPYDLAPGKGETGLVIGFEEVEENTGSGLVHIAPAFGEVDSALGARNDLAVVNPVDATGRYTEAFSAFAGRPVLEANQAILDDLESSGLIVRVHEHSHTYPHCWRCRQPLIYWAKPSWYIRTSAYRERLVEENQRVDWHPETIKQGRFGNWLRDNVDWALSRDRFWGTPLPLWRCEQGHVRCIGSREELASLAGIEKAEEVPTHRPEIDAVTFPCADCDGTATRIEAVGDVWLDSGCVPAAQWGFPAQDEDGFKSQFPADFICEAIDQTRGWFYSLLAIGTLVHGETPFRHVVCLGLLVDDEGRKMSKSIGNVVDPVEAVERFGADGVRWYLLASAAPWGTRRVSFDTMQQRITRDLDTLWNVAGFYAQYAELSDFDPSGDAGELSALDRWILSRTEGLVRSVTDALEDFSPHTATEAFSAYLDVLSNWYVRRSRPRFWDPDTHGTAALQTLHQVLVTVSRLLAPFCPFLSDMIYRGVLGEGADSVHLADWPQHRPSLVDEPLETSMDVARRISQAGRAARSASGVAVRQPLAEAAISGATSLSDELVGLIADELNVRRVAFREADTTDVQIAPNWKTLGPRFRDRMGDVAAALKELPAATVAAGVAAHQSVTIALGDESVELVPEDIVVSESAARGWAAAEEGGITVALDTNLDDDLLAEGRMRTLIRQVQLARRESGLHVSDRIDLFLDPEYLPQGETIAREVLARNVLPIDDSPADAIARQETFAFTRHAGDQGAA